MLHLIAKKGYSQQLHCLALFRSFPWLSDSLSDVRVKSIQTVFGEQRARSQPKTWSKLGLLSPLVDSFELINLSKRKTEHRVGDPCVELPVGRRDFGRSLDCDHGFLVSGRVCAPRVAPHADSWWKWVVGACPTLVWWVYFRFSASRVHKLYGRYHWDADLRDQKSIDFRFGTCGQPFFFDSNACLWA